MSRPSSDQSKSETFKAPRSRNRRFFVLGFLIVIAMFVLFAPTILVNTPLKQSALDYAFSDVNGNVKVGKITVGWFSPVRLEHVTLADANGQEVIAVDSIATSNRLLSFLSGDDLGTVEITRPTFDLFVRPDGSNIEDIFANYINAPASETESSLPKIKIKIMDGIARVSSDTVPQIGVIEKITALAHCMTGKDPLTIDLQCQSSTNQGSAGNIVAKIVADPRSRFVYRQINTSKPKNGTTSPRFTGTDRNPSLRPV